MTHPAVKDAAQRHVADAAYHVLEAERAIVRARERVATQEARRVLTRLATGQGSVRRVLAHVGNYERGAA